MLRTIGERRERPFLLPVFVPALALGGFAYSRMIYTAAFHRENLVAEMCGAERHVLRSLLFFKFPNFLWRRLLFPRRRIRAWVRDRANREQKKPPVWMNMR
jgi:hypothetical protein